MKLSLLILVLAMSMATGYGYYPRSEEKMEESFNMNALIESLFAKQQAIGELHTTYSK